MSSALGLVQFWHQESFCFLFCNVPGPIERQNIMLRKEWNEADWWGRFLITDILLNILFQTWRCCFSINYYAYADVHPNVEVHTETDLCIDAKNPRKLYPYKIFCQSPINKRLLLLLIARESVELLNCSNRILLSVIILNYCLT